jgi:hypothetical protein
MKDFPRHIALKASEDLLLREPLHGSPSHIVDRGLMPAQTDDHDSVQGCVGLPISPAIQPVSTGGPSRGGRNRAHATGR